MWKRVELCYQKNKLLDFLLLFKFSSKQLHIQIFSDNNSQLLNQVVYEIFFFAGKRFTFDNDNKRFLISKDLHLNRRRNIKIVYKVWQKKVQTLKNV